MTESLFRRTVVPLASPEDAAATAAALGPYVDDVIDEVVAVHVIEKAGGAPDKASVEQREQRAEEIFEVVADELAGTSVVLETRIRYGTDVAETIVGAAHEANATAIVFTPRGGSRWLRMLTGDVSLNLITSADLPVLVLPDTEEVNDA